MQEEVLVESGVQLYVDLKHTAVVRPVIHVLTRAIEAGGWAADRLIVATFRQFDLLQVMFGIAIPRPSLVLFALLDWISAAFAPRLLPRILFPSERSLTGDTYERSAYLSWS